MLPNTTCRDRGYFCKYNPIDLHAVRVFKKKMERTKKGSLKKTVITGPGLRGPSGELMENTGKTHAIHLKVRDSICNEYNELCIHTQSGSFKS